MYKRQVRKVTQVHKDLKVLKERQDQQDPQVLKVHKDLKVVKEQQDPQVLLEQEALRVKKVK